MSSKHGMSSQQIDAAIEKKTEEMLQNQKDGLYVDAQKCRVALQNLKKQYQTAGLEELKQKQKQEKNELLSTQKEETNSFNDNWDKSLSNAKQQGERLEKQMSDRHQEEISKQKAELEENLPKKVKQSSELLNLRKMEEHMAKQKKYLQAHDVQTRCKQMQKQEEESWQGNRNQKMGTSVKTLKSKQQQEMKVLKLRNSIQVDELQKKRAKEENSLKLKFENQLKELKMAHEKEVIAHKGHFKSKGGQATSSSMTKSKLLK